MKKILGVLLQCALLGALHAAPVQLVSQAPTRITTVGPGVYLVDFGQVAFGNIRFTPPSGASGIVTVHFGESLANGRVNRAPRGTIRYGTDQVTLSGTQSRVAAPPADARNTKTTPPPPAIRTPAAWGVVLPFRWVEIEGWPGQLRPEHLRRQAGFASTWDDNAASFNSSDDMLNRIWELCRYSIKATTFAGIYVDGDRERIPYEGDAYLNQLSHYSTDRDLKMARDTYDWLMAHPTWPTEWASHMVFMAHADWMHTGDAAWLTPRYEALKSKLLLSRVGADGLVTSSDAKINRGDLVDWPVPERNGYVLTSVNTVINAFYLRALTCMADIANAVGKTAEANDYTARESAARAVFQQKLYDSARGAYRDGVGTDHAAQHASMFPLAFGLVPPSERTRVATYVASKNMACSVYGAQYLLEGLFDNNRPATAMALITAPGLRSWRHMVDSGATITWEAWDIQYKSNLDWNHAWGAAPANLLPRFVLGARPLTPGWARTLIRPNPGNLTFADGKIPTPRGPITLDWQKGATFRLTISLPAGMTARVELPAATGSTGVFSGTTPVPAQLSGSRWILDADISGQKTLEVK